MQIGNIQIGVNHKPFIIAEMSGNHNKSLDRALEIAEAAAKSGAHALKLQTYTADTLTLDVKHGDFLGRLSAFFSIIIILYFIVINKLKFLGK